MKAATYSTFFLRVALGAGFLSAVADRFGGWGPPGSAHAAWGDFAHFTAYRAKLNWFVNPVLVPALAWIATIAETVLGIALVAGIFTRPAAFLSGILLLLFALAMTFSSGIKAPLDCSVFSASAGAFLLASCGAYRFSIDELRARS